MLVLVGVVFERFIFRDLIQLVEVLVFFDDEFSLILSDLFVALSVDQLVYQRRESVAEDESSFDVDVVHA